MADSKSLMKLKVVELRERLQALGKTPKGLKAELVKQLQEALEEQSDNLNDDSQQLIHSQKYQTSTDSESYVNVNETNFDQLSNANSILGNALQTAETADPQHYYQQSVGPPIGQYGQQVYDPNPNYMQTSYETQYQYPTHPVFSPPPEQFSQNTTPYQLTPQMAPQIPQQIPQQMSPQIPQQISPQIPQQMSPQIPQQISPQIPQQLSPRIAPQMTPQLSPQMAAQQYRPQEYPSPHQSFQSNESTAYPPEYSGQSAPEQMYGMPHLNIQTLSQTQSPIPSAQLVHRSPVIERFVDLPQTPTIQQNISSDMNASQALKPRPFIPCVPTQEHIVANEATEDLLNFDDVSLGVDPNSEVQYHQSIDAFDEEQNQTEFELPVSSDQFQHDMTDNQTFEDQSMETPNQLQDMATDDTTDTDETNQSDSNDNIINEEQVEPIIYSEPQIISESPSLPHSESKSETFFSSHSPQRSNQINESSTDSSDTNVTDVTDSQNVKDADSQHASDSDSQNAEDINSQNAEDINSQKAEDINSQNAEDINSQNAEDINSQNAEDINSQKAEDINSQNAEDINSQNAEDINSQKAEDINSQNPEDINSQIVEDIDSQKSETESNNNSVDVIKDKLCNEDDSIDEDLEQKPNEDIEQESDLNKTNFEVEDHLKSIDEDSKSSETSEEEKPEVESDDLDEKVKTFVDSIEPLVKANNESVVSIQNENEAPNNTDVTQNEPKPRDVAITQMSSKIEVKDNKKMTKNQKKKERKKKRAIKRKIEREMRNQTNEDDDRMDIDDENDDEEEVEIEYIPEQIKKDPIYFQYLKVFDKFRTGDTDRKDVDSQEEEIIDPVKKMLERKKPVELELKDEDEKRDGEPKLSKRKMKQMTRMTVAELKQIVSHPELVEMHDVTARDPLILLHLKSTRNSVPVPRHWCYKRKYLQGKRGFEKPPFKLPEFIRKTGIMEMRQALQEKEDSKSLKAKMREKIRPKMGKIDIDYQKLHDAFFKWQTKPKMTIHGDLYYEGKEFETRLKEKKPGELSNELRTALGMPTGPNSQKCPPPWLIAMQRYGPPPSYPNIKIPGLNAPIPEGCSFGYHAGGWGKPPVDEYGRPLYGDVFGVVSTGDQNHIEEEVDRTLWGELESESEEEEEEEDEEEEADASAAAVAGKAVAAKDGDETGFVTPAEGLITPSGLTSIPTGMETPDLIELRKRKQIEAEMESGDNPALFTVIPEKKADKSGREMMGSSHTYDISATTLRKGQGIDVALDPSDLEMGALDTAQMAARYEQTMKEQSSHLAKEDLSDMVAEHAARQKRKKQQDTSKSSKKYQFKF